MESIRVSRFMSALRKLFRPTFVLFSFSLYCTEVLGRADCGYDLEMRASLKVPADNMRLLDEIVAALRAVPNVVAVVLGGSYASGLANANSDLDIGLYYPESAPFAISQVRSIAERCSTTDSLPVVTGLYEWGPWVNGGAWINTSVSKVDFLYRNLDQVQAVIDEGT